MRSSALKPADGATFNAPLLPPSINGVFRPASVVPLLTFFRPRISHPLPPLAPSAACAALAPSSQAAAPTPSGAAPGAASTNGEAPATAEKRKKFRSCHVCGAGKDNNLACAGKNGQAKCKRECRGCGRFYGAGEDKCMGKAK